MLKIFTTFIWIPTGNSNLSVSPRIILIESNNPQSIAAVGISFKWIKRDSVLHSWQCHQRTLPQKVSHTFLLFHIYEVFIYPYAEVIISNTRHITDIIFK